jgi:hypothetical protein
MRVAVKRQLTEANYSKLHSCRSRMSASWLAAAYPSGRLFMIGLAWHSESQGAAFLEADAGSAERPKLFLLSAVSFVLQWILPD